LDGTLKMERFGLKLLETSGVYIAIYILKSIFLRQKKELWKNSNISLCKNIIFKKILSKKPKFFKIS
jgi:hypothetical protein